MRDGFTVIKDVAGSLSSNTPGIYKMLGEGDLVLYVGKAKNLQSRLRSYVNPNSLPRRVAFIVSQVVKVEIITVDSEIKALLLEANLIKSLKAKYNVIMRDDKFYPYIALSAHKYPRIMKYKGKPEGLGKYHGPFVSSLTVKHIISAIRKAFQLRSCSDSFFASRDRPCIEYEMKNCSAPCVGKISEEDYQKAVQMAHKALLGKGKELQKQLFDAMCKFSNNCEYEAAIICRDRLQALRSIQECMTFSKGVYKDSDFIAMYQRDGVCCIQVISYRDGVSYGQQPYFVENMGKASEEDTIGMFMLQVYSDPPARIYLNYTAEYLQIIGEALEKLLNRKVDVVPPKLYEEVRLMTEARKSAMEALNQRQCSDELSFKLEELAKFFGLPDTPKRIEVYDNSHTSGTNPFGVMIVCGVHGFLRREYKKFPIKGVSNGDDYAMMTELISSRFSNVNALSKPDFVLIDGGRGHISAVVDKLTGLGIPFACMAKGCNCAAGEEVFYLADGGKLSLDLDSKLMLYMREIRDEAHRFAITSHRKSRDTVRSVLDSIPGIGSLKKKSILTYFGSIHATRRAKAEEIVKVSGIGLELANRIVKHLQGN